MFILRRALRSYDKFFFTEKPTEGIALFRIIWIGLIFIQYLFDVQNIHDFYGPHALISFSTVKDQFPFMHANLFHLFNPSYEVTYALFIVYGLSLVTSMMGLFTRTSLVVALLCMTSFHQRTIWYLSSAEVLMRTITLLLIFSPCGHTLSLDSILGKYFPRFKQKRDWPVWALRLIQIQLSVVYLWTVWHKLKGETWLDGTAVYYATRVESLGNFSLPFIFNSVLSLKLMTWGTLLIEFALGTLIWHRKLRKPLIIIGLFFHLILLYVMGIWFEFYMMALLINFYRPEELKAFVVRKTEALVYGIQETNLATTVKEKMIRTLRGQI
ncbi:HTTM domain-containing protein [Peredibacter sp. HCB2-198]|uniref:HTTM domain-containing protein n=1 Tax=Peredibacter sp. HCB2-198 TaxID=3383025 RepID=UPI0038B4773B